MATWPLFFFAKKTTPFMEGVMKMILFIILAIVALAAIAVFGLSAIGVGAAIIAVFGDLIVFVIIIWMIVKLVQKNKKNN